MIKSFVVAAGLACVMASAANASTVYNTTLAPLPGTTTDASGTRTTSAGAQESAPAVVGAWGQANVGGGGTVGITTNYPDTGNGSAYFSTTSGSSKADLVDYFTNYATPVNLASLTSVSYDFYRSSASTVDANLTPVLRLDMKIDNNYAGSLVFENVYQSQAAAPVNTWTTLTATLNSGIFWASNAALGPTNASANGGQKTLQDWISANSGHTLSVYGVELGVGSGWNSGVFYGGADNVNLAFSDGTQVKANFEVAPGAVSAAPEPGTWVLMCMGVGLAGMALRRRKPDGAAIAT